MMSWLFPFIPFLPKSCQDKRSTSYSFLSDFTLNIFFGLDLRLLYDTKKLSFLILSASILLQLMAVPFSLRVLFNAQDAYYRVKSNPANNCTYL
jgi:hypothetical protein